MMINVTIYNYCCISFITLQIFTKLYINEGSVVGNEIVISADIENVIQGHH